MGNRRYAWGIASMCTIACRAHGVPADGGSESTGEPATTIAPGETDVPGEAGTTDDSDDGVGSTAALDTSTDAGTDTGDALDCDDFDAFVAALVDADPADRSALTEGFVVAAQYSEHGLPLRCDGRLIALAWEDGDATLALTGDFADWDPAAHPFTQPVAGFALRIADIAVSEPLAPSLYKLVRDGDSFVADPWARRFGWDENGEYSLTDARAGAGHHERWPGFAEGIGALAPRDVVVYLPADALTDGELAVLYMHDGQNLFAPDAFLGGWRVGAALDQARASEAVAPMMVVGIDNTAARFDEYTHVQDDIGQGLVGGRADEYADFVALGVKPFIDARYPTRSSRESTTVLGSSLGGLVSLYIAWRHPDVFAAAGSMSGTLDWGRLGAANDRIVELFQDDPPDALWIYLDSGGAGPCPGGADNYCVTIEMRDLLLELGWVEPDSLVHVHAPGASHDEAAWAARFPGFLAALAVARR